MKPESRMWWAWAMVVALSCTLVGARSSSTFAQDADPVLTIVEPGPQSPLVGVVRMRAEVTPAVVDVRHVEFYVNGELACVAPAPVPFECVWDAGSSPDPRIVRVLARLGSGGRLVRSMRTRARPAALFSAGTDAILVPVMVEDRRGRFVENLLVDDSRFSRTASCRIPLSSRPRVSRSISCWPSISARA